MNYLTLLLASLNSQNCRAAFTTEWSGRFTGDIKLSAKLMQCVFCASLKTKIARFFRIGIISWNIFGGVAQPFRRFAN